MAVITVVALVAAVLGCSTAPAAPEARSASAVDASITRHFAWHPVLSSAGEILAQRAVHPAMDLRVEVAGGRVAVGGRHTDEQVELWLGAVGRPGAMQETVDAGFGGTPEIVAGRITFDRMGATEWYELGPRGLEQGFDVWTRPAGSGPLILRVDTVGVERVERAGVAGLVLVPDAALAPAIRCSALEVRDAADREVPARLEPTDIGYEIVVDDNDALYPIHVDPIVSTEYKLSQSNVTAGDEYGAAVGIYGDVVAVGAPGLLLDVGVVYGYQPNPVFPSGPAWVQIRSAAYGPYVAGARFGQTVTVMSGWAFAGAPSYDRSGCMAGITTSDWRELFLRVGFTGDGLGLSLDADEPWVIAGEAMCGLGPGCSGPGRALVWRHRPPNWEGSATLLASDADGGSFEDFGAAVAMHTDDPTTGAATAAVSAPGHSHGGVTGAVYVFSSPGDNTWTQQLDEIPAPAGAVGFGRALDLDDGVLVVGAPRSSLAGLESGAAFVYEGAGSSWVLRQTLLPVSGARTHFGSSVSIDGDVLVVGAPGDDSRGTDAGAVYVYLRSGTEWSFEAKLLASDGESSAYFGSSVAVSGRRMIVGAPSGMAVNGTGAAYIYEFTVANGTHCTNPAILPERQLRRRRVLRLPVWRRRHR